MSFSAPGAGSLLRKIRRIVYDARLRNMLIYDNLQTLVARHGEQPENLTAKELRVFSQNGEDGVIAEIFRRIGPGTRHFVEFGIGDGVEGNCLFLADVLGWNGLFIEAQPTDHAALERKYSSNPRIATVRAQVSAENICSLLSGASVPETFDLLSIDIDGNDYWIWEATTTFNPRVVVIEYNGSLDPDSKLVQPYRADSSGGDTAFFGASLGALTDLAGRKGYRLVHTELSGTNAFFVRTDLMDAFSDVRPVARSANYQLSGGSHPPDRGQRRYIAL